MFKYLLFCIPFFLFAQTEEFDVYLLRKEERAAVYLNPIKIKETSISSEYLQKIQTLIRQDLSFLDKIILLKKDPLEKQSAFLQVHLEVQNTLLYVKAQTPSTSFSPSPIVLEGDLAKDRKKIHALFDDFSLTFFNKKSILSTKLLYSVREKKLGKWVSEIWESDFDGHNPRPIIQDKHYHLFPCSVLGKKDFYYVSFRSGLAKIYKNFEQDPFIQLSGNQILPNVSSDGSKIAFISDAAGRPDLFIQSYYDKPKQVFSYPRATQASPCFNPESDKIAFVSDKDGSARIYLIDIANFHGKRPQAQLITKKNKENTCPNWSTDGRKIAYSAKTEGIRQIWVYDFETREEMQITFSPENKENPSWAIDNCHIVFNTEENSELFIVNTKTNRYQKVSQGSGQKRFAVWQTY